MKNESGITKRRGALGQLLRRGGMVLGAATLGTLAACSSDRLEAPAAVERSNSTLGGLLFEASGQMARTNGLSRDGGSVSSIARSQTFDRRGGALSIPELGFTLTVPADAIPGRTLTITVTSLSGAMVAYDFEPHGTKFLRPLTLTQDLRGTSAFGGSLRRTALYGSYFKSATQVNTLNLTALVDESFAIVLHGTNASFDITHFSGYMVSTGRSDPSDTTGANGTP